MPKKPVALTPCEFCRQQDCEGDCPQGLIAIRASNARVAHVSHRDVPTDNLDAQGER